MAPPGDEAGHGEMVVSRLASFARVRAKSCSSSQCIYESMAYHSPSHVVAFADELGL